MLPLILWHEFYEGGRKKRIFPFPVTCKFLFHVDLGVGVELYSLIGAKSTFPLPQKTQSQLPQV